MTASWPGHETAGTCTNTPAWRYHWRRALRRPSEPYEHFVPEVELVGDLSASLNALGEAC